MNIKIKTIMLGATLSSAFTTWGAHNHFPSKNGELSKDGGLYRPSNFSQPTLVPSGFRTSSQPTLVPSGPHGASQPNLSAPASLSSPPISGAPSTGTLRGLNFGAPPTQGGYSQPLPPFGHGSPNSSQFWGTFPAVNTSPSSSRWIPSSQSLTRDTGDDSFGKKPADKKFSYLFTERTHLKVLTSTDVLEFIEKKIDSIASKNGQHPFINLAIKPSQDYGDTYSLTSLPTAPVTQSEPLWLSFNCLSTATDSNSNEIFFSLQKKIETSPSGSVGFLSSEKWLNPTRTTENEFDRYMEKDVFTMNPLAVTCLLRQASNNIWGINLLFFTPAVKVGNTSNYYVLEKVLKGLSGRAIIEGPEEELSLRDGLRYAIRASDDVVDHELFPKIDIPLHSGRLNWQIANSLRSQAKDPAQVREAEEAEKSCLKSCPDLGKWTQPSGQTHSGTQSQFLQTSFHMSPAPGAQSQFLSRFSPGDSTE